MSFWAFFVLDLKTNLPQIPSPLGFDFLDSSGGNPGEVGGFADRVAEIATFIFHLGKRLAALVLRHFR